MKEHRILVGDLPMHFRTGGKGAPLLMLHPSPSSSKALMPIASHLTDHFTVIALDTPGYGESPSFERDSYSMDAYAELIHGFLSALGIDKIAIYGSATGGQLAVRYGIMYPGSVEHLFLDNCAHFPEDLRTNIIDNYFPDLTPRLDAQHLHRIWDVSTHLFKFFPWCCQTEEYKVDMPELPVVVYHTVAMEYLIAGEHYYRAYRSAFLHERAEFIQQLSVPATIIRWQGSIVKKYTDLLFNYNLPNNVGQRVIPAPAAERYEGLKSLITEKYTSTSNFEINIDDALFQSYSNEKSNRLNAFAQRSALPTLKMDGSHLNEAWDILKIEHPTADAKTIQQMLIDWYTYSAKA